MITEKSKRKNDDPRRYYRIAAVAFAIILASLFAAALYIHLMANYDPPAPTQPLPTGTLYYLTGQTAYALNMQTHETTSVSSLPPLEDQISDAISHDGLWQIHWSVNADDIRYDMGLQSLQTQEQRPLGSFYLAEVRASWSADNEWIAISAYEGLEPDGTLPDKAQIWVIHRASGEAKRVTNINQSATGPRFAPIGTQLAYLLDGTIWVTDTVSGLKDRVQDIPLNDAQFAWSPDAQWIAYRSMPPAESLRPKTRDAAMNIWVVRVDGSGEQMLISTGSVHQIVGWTP